RGELWFAGETAEAVLLELEARRRSLAAEVDQLTARAAEAANIAADATVAAREAAAAMGNIRVQADPAVLRRIAAVAEGVVSCLKLEVEWFEAPLRALAESGTARTTELGAELRRLGAEEVELRRATVEAAERVSALEVDLARTGAEAEEA